MLPSQYTKIGVAINSGGPSKQNARAWLVLGWQANDRAHVWGSRRLNYTHKIHISNFLYLYFKIYSCSLESINPSIILPEPTSYVSITGNRKPGYLQVLILSPVCIAYNGKFYRHLWGMYLYAPRSSSKGLSTSRLGAFKPTTSNDFTDVCLRRRELVCLFVYIF